MDFSNAIAVGLNCLILIMKVQSVKHVEKYTIHVKFTDGVEGDVELSGLVGKGIFNALQNEAVFAKVFTTGYSIAWSDELEIDADTIYMELTGKSISELPAQNPAHASN